MNLRIMLKVALSTVVLSCCALASPVQSSCWTNSPPENDQCGYGLVCVEWDEDGAVVASDCCQPGELGSLHCGGFCQPVPIDRPVATVPGSPRTAIEQWRTAAKAFSEPFLPAPSEPESTRPLLSVIFNGTRHSPEAFAELAPAEVHFLFRLDDGIGRSALFAFASWQELTHTFEETGVFNAVTLSKASVVPVPVVPESSGVTLFEGEMWQGAARRLEEGQPIDFQNDPWARQISSLRGSGPGWVTFFDQAGLEGSSLTLSTAWDRPSLKPFGWNNRLASGFVWPRRFVVQQP